MPLHDANGAITLAHLTDPHLLAEQGDTLQGVNTDHMLQGVLEHMHQHSRQPALLLATGDLTQDGSPQGYQRFLEHAASLQVPVHALPGNHDTLENFHAVLGEKAHPVIELPHWRIVMLDSVIPGEDGGRLGESQLDLLDALSQEDDSRHVLVAMHHQPVPMHSAWLDTMMIANAEALFERLARYPQVQALLWGHVHQAHDETLALSQGLSGRRLRLMATPSTCFQFKPRSEAFILDPIAPGYRWITLHADGDISTDVVRVPELYRG